MAIYPKAVQRLIPPGPGDPRITPRVAILHVDAGGATGEDLYRYFNGPSGGIESHFHIQYDGTVYQYRDTAYQADANCDANNFAVSIETQGKGAGEWTPAQLASIKSLLLWLSQVHPIPLEQCPRWDAAGVGYHILFMQQWAGGPRACPGPDRIRQFHNVIVPWLSNASGPQLVAAPEAPALKEWDVMATKDEIRAVVREEIDAAFRADVIPSPMFKTNPTVARDSALRFAMEWALQARDRAGINPATLAAEIVKALPAGGTSQADVEAALRNVLGSLDT